MRNGIAGIDHVIIAVRDLDRARLAWSRLGFALSPRGRHIGQGTADYCIMFGAGYVELLGVIGGDNVSQRLSAFLTRREGAMAVAFAAAAELADVHSRLRGLRLHPSEPRPLSRQIELPEGTAVPRLDLITLPGNETPALESFICADLTPQLMRRPQWLTHPNGAHGLSGIQVLVENTTALLEPYDRLFGIQQVTTTDAVVCVQVGGYRIVFSTPDDFMTMYPQLEIDPEFPLPGIIALDLAGARCDDTADYFTRQQVPFDEMPDGSLVVPASEASGTLLFFDER